MFYNKDIDYLFLNHNSFKNVLKPVFTKFKIQNTLQTIGLTKQPTANLIDNDKTKPTLIYNLKARTTAAGNH